MKNISLELPQGLFTSEQTQILNERLREIQQNLGVAVELRGDLDAGGGLIRNLGDAKDGKDALNLRTAELRFPPTGANPGSGGSGAVTQQATAGENTLIFGVAGALAIQAGAAPLAMLAKPRTAAEIVGVLINPTDEGPVVADIHVGQKRWATLTIPQGALQARMPAVGLGPIAANQPIRLDLVAVGMAPGRPGETLTVLIRLV
jgi:hypothetical protein